MFCRQLIRSLTPLAIVAPRCSTALRFTSTEGGQQKPTEEPAADASASKPKLDTEAHNLQAEMKTLRDELKEMKSAHLYAVADAENARRIGREDAHKARDFAVTGFSKDMLEVSDTLEKAIESMDKIDPAVTSSNVMLQHTITGIKMSYSVLMKNLSRHGIEPIPTASGETFDPKMHDAIFTAPASDKVKAGCITNVVKKGYMIKERVLRPAQVGVAEDAPK